MTYSSMHKTLVRQFYERDVGRKCKSTSRLRRLRVCLDGYVYVSGECQEVEALWEQAMGTHKTDQLMSQLRECFISSSNL